MSDNCQIMVTGSSNGAVALWDLKYRVFQRIVMQDEESEIEKILLLKKDGPRAIIATSEPDLLLCDLSNGSRRAFIKFGGMGKCEQIRVEKSE
jgi:hypothetical protein